MVFIKNGTLKWHEPTGDCLIGLLPPYHGERLWKSSMKRRKTENDILRFRGMYTCLSAF